MGKDSILSGAGRVVTEWAIPDPKASPGEPEPRSAVSLMRREPRSEIHGDSPSITAMQVRFQTSRHDIVAVLRLAFECLNPVQAESLHRISPKWPAPM